MAHLGTWDGFDLDDRRGVRFTGVHKTKLARRLDAFEATLKSLAAVRVEPLDFFNLSGLEAPPLANNGRIF